jgi:hypothetical protein
MARTATGSTAEMSAEKTRQSVVCSVYDGADNSTPVPSGIWTLPIHPIDTKPSKESPIYNNFVLKKLVAKRKIKR